MGYEGLSETLVSHLLQKALFPIRLSCISLFGLHTAALSAVAVPVLISKSKSDADPIGKLYRQNTGDSLAISLAAFQNLRNAFVFWQTS